MIDNISVINLEEVEFEKKYLDLFITCSSFEERCVNCSNKLVNLGFSIDTAIIFNYIECDSQNKKIVNSEKMIADLSHISKQTFSFNSASVANPENGMKTFLELYGNILSDFKNKSIGIEITVFTKPYFFLLFKVLTERYHFNRFQVYYTEPEHYNFRDPEQNEIILTEGLDRIEAIPGFYGSSKYSKDIMVVILGFEGKRALDVFYNIDPEHTYVINGFPSYQPGWEKVSLEANQYFLKESRSENNVFFAPAIDPFETINTLNMILRQIGGKSTETNIVIAPLGTKLQALGVMLYCLIKPEIKVIYPFPSSYNANFSYKSGPSHIISVDFNTLMVSKGDYT